MLGGDVCLLKDPILKVRVELALGCTVAAMFITLAPTLADSIFLFRWSSMSCAFVHRSFKCLTDQVHRQVVPEIVEARAYKLLWGEFLWTNKGKSLPFGDEACDTFHLTLLRFNELWHSHPSLNVAELSQKPYCMLCQLGID